MKIGGVPVTSPPIYLLVLARDGGDLVFKAKAVEDFMPFNLQCPSPKAPTKLVKGGKVVEDLKDKSYVALKEDHDIKFMAWMTINSLEPSEIEWETVDINKPSTWTNYVTDLRKAGITAIEMKLIGDLVIEANSLDDRKLDEARERFLRGQADQPES